MCALRRPGERRPSDESPVKLGPRRPSDASALSPEERKKRAAEEAPRELLNSLSTEERECSNHENGRRADEVRRRQMEDVERRKELAELRKAGRPRAATDEPNLQSKLSKEPNLQSKLSKELQSKLSKEPDLLRRSREVEGGPCGWFGGEREASGGLWGILKINNKCSSTLRHHPVGNGAAD